MNYMTYECHCSVGAQHISATTRTTTTLQLIYFRFSSSSTINVCESSLMEATTTIW
jgi:hypothetical protein